MTNAEQPILPIDLENGEQRHIALSRFAAMDGWDIQHRYLEFVSTNDKQIRRSYTLEVLSYASVIIGDARLPISTGAVVESHLQSWEAVDKVFRAVLLHNGIDPDTHADRPGYWESVGGELAVAFIAQATKLIGPALESTMGERAPEPTPESGD
jgi:hypothetical protein